MTLVSVISLKQGYSLPKQILIKRSFQRAHENETHSGVIIRLTQLWNDMVAKFYDDIWWH